MTFVGVIYILEGLLIMLMEIEVLLPVFNRKGNIIGGFSFSRYWANTNCDTYDFITNQGSAGEELNLFNVDHGGHYK